MVKAFEDDLNTKPKRDFKYSFELFPERLTWADAKTACETDPSTGEKWADERRTLAVITSVEDQRKVNDIINAYVRKNNGDLGGLGAWIGVTDAEEEDYWRLADGSRAAYQPWSPGEPSNGGNGEDCVTFWRQWTGGDGVWNDAACGSKRSYVCSTRETQYVDQDDQPLGPAHNRIVEKHPFFCKKYDSSNPFNRKYWPEIEEAKANTSPTSPYFADATQEELARVWKLMGWTNYPEIS